MSLPLTRLSQNPKMVARGNVDVPVHARQWYELPGRDDGIPETWCYTDKFSYSSGELVTLFGISTTNLVDIEVWRESLKPDRVFQQNYVPMQWADTHDLASVNGCEWPQILEINVAKTWQSGMYRIAIKPSGDSDSEVIAEHLFVVRSLSLKSSRRLVLITAEATWHAYNDWGGCNHYEGVIDPESNRFAPHLSIHRPFARGFVSLPDDSPRTLPRVAPAVGLPPSYPHMEWAWQHGYSKKYASAGWASYEKHFVHWAESEGYQVDMISQHDLHYRPEVIEPYGCAVIVGHDEYWSWQMRDAMDHYIENGGKLARFAGNFLWQIRLKQEGGTQICHKYNARQEDPYYGSEQPQYTTNCWEASEVGRPGYSTMGITGSKGIYAGWGGLAVHGARGFTVYRPEHWAFENTQLGYGDFLGHNVPVFGYEVDGLDYRIESGLPFPVDLAELPDDLCILAMGLARNREDNFSGQNDALFVGDEDAKFLAQTLHGNDDPETVAKVNRGSGMVVTFTRGKGEVFNAGTTEWVAGLIRRDQSTIQVTRNVINRFMQ